MKNFMKPAEDEKKKDLVDKKNTAETSIFAAEKSLKEYGDKLDEATKTSINEKIRANLAITYIR